MATTSLKTGKIYHANINKPYSHDVTICINKIIKRAKKNDESITDIEFSLSSIKRFLSSPDKYKTGQEIRIYRKTKSGKQKVQKSFIGHKFCPFCGKKF